MIEERATPEDRRQLAEWARKAPPDPDPSPSGATWGRDRGRRAYGALLLLLIGPDADDETFLQVCSETGRVADLVERLLNPGRVDEAADRRYYLPSHS